MVRTVKVLKMERTKAKAAAKLLEEYRANVQGIRTLQSRLQKIIKYSGPSELTAVSLDLSGGGNSYHKSMENIADEIQKIKRSIAEKRIEIQLIEDALMVISHGRYCEHYADVLIMRHVDGYTMNEIAIKLGYSSRQTVYDQYYKALNKFACAMGL